MPDKTESTFVLPTKLYPPPLPTDHVPRVQLAEHLEQNRHKTLTVVSSPAGYGKSTLLSHWLQTCECPSAWVSLDADDNDLHQFLS